MTLSEELAWRGFKNQTTFADSTDLDKTPRTFYLGGRSKRFEYAHW